MRAAFAMTPGLSEHLRLAMGTLGRGGARRSTPIQVARFSRG